MKPKIVETTSYRGFYATYELTQEALYLRSLKFSEKNNHYLPIQGVMPTIRDCQAIYKGLSVVVRFTGKLRLAKDFIEEFYIDMGFQIPVAFKTVLDVTLRDGEVVEIKDRSEEMEKKRKAFKRRESDNVFELIEEGFDLDSDS